MLKKIIITILGIFLFSCSLTQSNDSNNNLQALDESVLSNRSIVTKVDVTSYGEIHRATGIPVDSSFEEYNKVLDGNLDTSVSLDKDNFQYMGKDTNNYYQFENHRYNTSITVELPENEDFEKIVVKMGEYSNVSIVRAYACISDDKSNWGSIVDDEVSNKSFYSFSFNNHSNSGRYVQIGFNFFCNKMTDDTMINIKDIKIYAKPINLNNSKLEKVIRNELGKELDNIGLCRTDLLEVTKLYMSGEDKSDDEKLDNLSGLEYCTNITDLQLPYNNLESDDLENITSLTKLKNLNLCGNKISNIESFMESYDFLPPAENMSKEQKEGVKFRFEDLKYLNLKKNNMNIYQHYILDENGVPDYNTISNINWNEVINKYQYKHLYDLEKCVVDYIDTDDDENRNIYKHRIKFKDYKLEKHIRNKIGKTNNEYIYTEDLLGIEEIIIEDISSLSGLEYCVNLKTLKSLKYKSQGFANYYHGYISIDDIRELKSLTKLEKLHIIYTEATNLEPLKGLTSLKELVFECSYESLKIDLSPLTNLINLEKLDLSNFTIERSDDNESFMKNISRFKKLRSLSLDYLDVTDDELRNIKDIRTLTHLSVKWGELTDISYLENFTNLTELNLEGNDIEDITVIELFTSLTSLNIGHNEISNLSPIRGLTNLTKLSIDSLNPGWNHITNYNDLSLLTELTYLNASGNSFVYDISALKNLTKLSYLNITDNDLSDSVAISHLDALSKLTDITFLYANYNNIVNISALNNLTKLKKLDLSNNNIEDIGVLQSLTNLERLYLHCNEISVIEPLSNLSKLRTLYLNSNNIESITPLKNLTIWQLNINNNGMRIMPDGVGPDGEKTQGQKNWDIIYDSLNKSLYGIFGQWLRVGNITPYS